MDPAGPAGVPALASAVVDGPAGEALPRSVVPCAALYAEPAAVAAGVVLPGAVRMGAAAAVEPKIYT